MKNDCCGANKLKAPKTASFRNTIIQVTFSGRTRMSRKVSRRAQLLQAQMPIVLSQYSLQQYVLGALVAPVDLDSTAIESAQFGTLRLNQAPQVSRRGGTKLKIVGHAPNEHATTVPLRLTGASTVESTARPPDEHSFKNSDFFLVIKGNQILGFGDHMRIETAVSFVRTLLAKRYNNAAFAAISASNVFNYNAGQQLADEGVKAIEFEASLSAASADALAENRFKSPIRQFVSEISDQLSQLVAQDVDASQLAGVRVEISIAVDGGVRGSNIANDAVFLAANSLLEHPENDVPEIAASIRTRQGNTVSLSSATVGKLYRLNRRQNENSMIDQEAWDALEDFDDHISSLGEMRT